MNKPPTDPLDFLNAKPGGGGDGHLQTELIQQLLYEIIRVKGLVKYYEAVPNNAGHLGAAILSELVTEAYRSLVDYDINLMKKYYELLQSCD